MQSFGWMFAVCILIAPFALTQTSPTLPALVFDVAAVRPSKPGSLQHTNIPLDTGNVYAEVGSEDARSSDGGLLIATHQPLWRYISFAYKLSGS